MMASGSREARGNARRPTPTVASRRDAPMIQARSIGPLQRIPRYEDDVVNRTANAEGYMLPLGGPEFWLQAELQDAMDRLIKTSLPRRAGDAARAVPAPRAEQPHDVERRPLLPGHRLDPARDALPPRPRHRRDAAGAEARAGALGGALALRPPHRAARRASSAPSRTSSTRASRSPARRSPQKERAQRRYWHMTCPRCRRTYRRGRRDKVACRTCCDTYAGGQYDRRFRLVVISRAE